MQHAAIEVGKMHRVVIPGTRIDVFGTVVEVYRGHRAASDAVGRAAFNPHNVRWFAVEVDAPEGSGLPYLYRVSLVNVTPEIIAIVHQKHAASIDSRGERWICRGDLFVTGQSILYPDRPARVGA